MSEMSNEAAIEQWNTIPWDLLEKMDGDGDFSKRHLMNPHLLRLLGELPGRRILDAGCGNGYLSRMLAAGGAEVTGVEPTEVMHRYAVRREAELGQGITYRRADLTRLPADLGGPFDAVVCSMVLAAVPEWKAALRACVRALRPGGLLVFSVNHPAFEQLWRTWQKHGAYRTDRYLAEYAIPGGHGTDFHRPLSAYLNELAALGCRLTECVEPGLDPETAARAEAEAPGISAYVHLPNFLIVAAEAPAADPEVS